VTPAPTTSSDCDPAPLLEVELTEASDATWVRPRGELDLCSAPELREALRAQRGPVVLDLRELAFIDASGLHVMVEADVRARRDGLDLTVLPGPVAGRLLGLTGLGARLPIAAA
jgi:anti-sigma B factor antagonist